MAIYDVKVNQLDGTPASLGDYKGKALLIVNVASKCGLTPQYEGLEKLHEKLGGRGFEVLGFPCNQFMEQEPGSAEEIQEFCSLTYGVDFPLFEKIDVNGDNQNPLYAQLNETAGRRGLHRRHPLELREVPGQPRGRGRRPVRPDRRAQRPGAHLRHRGPAPQLETSDHPAFVRFPVTVTRNRTNGGQSPTPPEVTIPGQGSRE